MNYEPIGYNARHVPPWEVTDPDEVLSVGKKIYRITDGNRPTFVITMWEITSFNTLNPGYPIYNCRNPDTGEEYVFPKGYLGKHVWTSLVEAQNKLIEYRRAAFMSRKWPEFYQYQVTVSRPHPGDGMVNISFPDFPGFHLWVSPRRNVITLATNVLQHRLFRMEFSGEKIPRATNNGTICKYGLIYRIDIPMVKFREMMLNGGTAYERKTSETQGDHV